MVETREVQGVRRVRCHEGPSGLDALAALTAEDSCLMSQANKPQRESTRSMGISDGFFNSQRLFNSNGTFHHLLNGDLL